MAREHVALLGGPHMEPQESLLRRLASVVKETVSLAVFSFGGPPVHVALAHDRFVCEYSSPKAAFKSVVDGVKPAVDKKKWLTDARFLETFSIVSAIPGPSSTQVRIFSAFWSSLRVYINGFYVHINS